MVGHKINKVKGNTKVRTFTKICHQHVWVSVETNIDTISKLDMVNIDDNNIATIALSICFKVKS